MEEVAMKTRHWRPILAFVTALAFVSAACKDSNTVSGPPPTPTPALTPTPLTPTPVATVNVEGAWVGTFDSIDLDCAVGTAASATFTQSGSSVEGVLDMTEAGCGGTEVGFHGVMNGDHLQGNLNQGGGGRYSFWAGSTADGPATETTLELTLHNTA